MTIEEVAYIAGITPGTLSKIERARMNPSWTTVERVAEALDITVAEIASLAEASR